MVSYVSVENVEKKIQAGWVLNWTIFNYQIVTRVEQIWKNRRSKFVSVIEKLSAY